MRYTIRFKLIFFLSLFIASLSAQGIPADRVLEPMELGAYLKPDIQKELQLKNTMAVSELALYFRNKFAERFFYDYRAVDKRLDLYNELYGNQVEHAERALDHLGKYTDSTSWILPFNYVNGGEVNAYALRHLARQHKMVDIALYYFEQEKNPEYIRYFENQLKSLNAAFDAGKYERIEDGNGVYEVFRSGYRILNWLTIHNLFLNEAEYSDEDQLRTIATLLQHGAHLYERNDQFRSGNHQTRGMSALAMLSILFRDFEGTDKWFERAMQRLSEHQEKEINPDGFQFERSVHYHMSDINNYFYVYQLAKISGIDVDQAWEQKLRILFKTLVNIAYPDKSAPVLQDDTEIPWGEKNDITGVMTLGYLLFEDPEFGYFASNRVDDRMYWFLTQAQLDLLGGIQMKTPEVSSYAFEDTHYYVMREGWNPNDKMMVISAGLDADKPDHQHGDMLGIQAIANKQAILPNYQVRYSLKDFELFKNSMVKNVALVDDELQGKQWTSNKGGSGFGKFKSLPSPKVIAWESNDVFDFFAGSHNGFKNIDVEYTRQVIYLKDDFWLVKDNFNSNSSHEYKQVWQGHYTRESGPNLIRATFADASGVDIFQLNSIDSATSSGARGKNWTVLSKMGEKNFEFLTLIFPYEGYNNRIDELNEVRNLKGWMVNPVLAELVVDEQSIVLNKENQFYIFGVSSLKWKDLTIQSSNMTDLYFQIKEGKMHLYLLGDENSTLTIRMFKNDKASSQAKEMLPGGKLIVEL